MAAASTLRGSNSDGFSAPQLINQTEAWWVGPNEVRPGEQTSIFGRNLAHDNVPAEGAAAASTVVYITGYDDDGLLIGGQRAAVTKVNPFSTGTSYR